MIGLRRPCTFLGWEQLCPSDQQPAAFLRVREGFELRVQVVFLSFMKCLVDGLTEKVRAF